MADQVAAKCFQEVLTLVEREVGPRTFQIWFRDVVLKSLHRGTLVMGVPNLFFRDFIDERYSRVIARAAQAVIGTVIRIEVKVDPELFRQHQERISAEEVADALESTPEPTRTFDLDSFVEVPENEFSRRAICHAAKKEAPNFNPILIAGASGVGKTHLLRAYRHEYSQHNDQKVLMTDALQFTSHFTMALKMKTVEQFRSYYERFGVIIIDEIHRFQGKKATQVEFTLRLKAWLNNGTQVLMASRHRPQDIHDVSKSFQSLPHAGLVTEIRPYSADSLVEIMSRGLGPDRRSLRTDVLRRLAKTCQGSLGRLKSRVLRLHAYAALLREEVTPEFVDAHSAELFSGQKGSEYTRIIETTAKNFDVSSEALLSKRKVKSLRLPRGVVVCTLRDQHQLTFKEIGRILGGRSHTSIHLIYTRYRPIIEASAELRDFVTRLGQGRNGSS